jgi:radical S-adenosyl methionine domain-containing protein 2
MLTNSQAFAPLSVDELVVNWHLLEACNYSCKFCYAHWADLTNKSDIWKDKAESYRLLEELWRFFEPGNTNNVLADSLKWQGVRLSLAGGEPTLLRDRLVDIAQFARGLGFNVSLITNGSRPGWKHMGKLAQAISILGISIDSADAERNTRIGRTTRSGEPLTTGEILALVQHARSMNPNLTVKVNTVVNSENADEDLSNVIRQINPSKWKILRVLPVLSEDLSVESRAFSDYVLRHSEFGDIISAEDNDEMTQSYIMVDPQGRFFQNRSGGAGYVYSSPIQSVGASAAFSQIPFSVKAFFGRY